MRMSGQKVTLKILLFRNDDEEEEEEEILCVESHDFLERSISQISDIAKTGKKVVEWANVPISVMFPHVGNMIDKLMTYVDDDDEECEGQNEGKMDAKQLDGDFYSSLTQLASCLNSSGDIKAQAHTMNMLIKVIEEMPTTNSKKHNDDDDE